MHLRIASGQWDEKSKGKAGVRLSLLPYIPCADTWVKAGHNLLSFRGLRAREGISQVSLCVTSMRLRYIHIIPHDQQKLVAFDTLRACS